MINCKFELSGRVLRDESRYSAGSTSDLQKNTAGSQLSVNTKAPSTVKAWKVTYHIETAQSKLKSVKKIQIADSFLNPTLVHTFLVFRADMKKLCLLRSRKLIDK